MFTLISIFVIVVLIGCAFAWLVIKQKDDQAEKDIAATDAFRGTRDETSWPKPDVVKEVVQVAAAVAKKRKVVRRKKPTE